LFSGRFDFGRLPELGAEVIGNPKQSLTFVSRRHK